MKKTILVSMSVLCILLCIFFACTKSESDNHKQGAGEKTASAIKPQALGGGTYTCGSIISGNYTGVTAGGTGTYYAYPYSYIDITGVATGATVTLVCNAYDVPNRVSVYNTAKTSVLATTGWFGNSTVAGPWGANLNTQSQLTITFTKSAGDNIYPLLVETGPKKDSSDAYGVTIYCSGSDQNCGSKPCPNPVVCSCGSFYTDNFTTLNQYHQYTKQNLNLGCVQTGANVQVYCDPISVPNRFTIYDAAGQFVTSTPWLGTATWTGAWGFASPQQPYSKLAQTISFTKNSSGAVYQILVETQTPPNSTYNPSTDNWTAKLICP